MRNVGEDAIDWRNGGENASDWAGGKERDQTEPERPCEAWRRGLRRRPLRGSEALGAGGTDGEETIGGGVARGGKGSCTGNGGGSGARGIGGEGTRGVGGGSKGTGGRGRRGRNAPAPTWPLRRRKTGGSRRLRIGTGGWDANLGRGWARPSDCRSGERGKWGHRVRRWKKAVRSAEISLSI